MNQKDFETKQEQKLREVVKNLTEFAGKGMDEEIPPDVALTFLINEIAAHRLLFEEIVVNYHLIVKDLEKIQDLLTALPTRVVKVEWETKDEAKERR